MKDRKMGNEIEENINIQQLLSEHERIEIWIKNQGEKSSVSDLNRMFHDYFQGDFSLIAPSSIAFEGNFHSLNTRLLNKEIPLNYIVLQESSLRFYHREEALMFLDENEQEQEFLTQLEVTKYPNLLLIFIKIKIYGFDFEKWEKLFIIIKKVINKMQELNFEIESIRPAEFQNLFLLEGPGMLNQSLPIPVSPWEKIEDHARDREILRLWHQGRTNSEIGERLSLTGKSVTNIISMLRKKYGNEIVPTNEKRNRKKSP